MHYKIPGVTGDLLKLDNVDSFAKEHGVLLKDAVEKLSIKKKDLPQDKAQITIMKTS